MRAFVRAAFAAALVLLLSVPAIAADKAFKRADLADAAIKLEAQIKAESARSSRLNALSAAMAGTDNSRTSAAA